VDGKASRTPLAKITTSSPFEKQELITWAGFSHKYFFFGLIPENASLKTVRVSATPTDKALELKTTGDLILNEKQIPPGETTSYTYSYYIGPKQLNELATVQADLQKAIDYGDWIGPIARFLLSILHFFYSLIPNYGVAIILLTILVKMALYPLAKKSAISMRRLQQVQPKMKEIREKYKNDKQRINVETMKLYKEEKVNPVGGCFPLLIQMPVFFALYRVFYASIELRQAPFFGWIKDLAVHDPYFVTPVLMTALMWYQQKMTPQPPVDDDNEAAKMQRSMMKWMPIVFGGVMIFLPAGLTLYFLVSALITIIQTSYLNKILHTKVAPVGI
jgi:YidC/Oxa1 family membrane protein insertase